MIFLALVAAMATCGHATSAVALAARAIHNRAFALAVHAPTAGAPDPVPHNNDRSWLYGYDNLDRLIAADFGSLNSANVAIQANPSVPRAIETTWSLDILGNWAPQQPAELQPGDLAYQCGYVRRYDTNGDGDYSDSFAAINQPVRLNNRIATLVDNLAETDFIHDRRGNLVWDGNYVYRYDAFSRLVGVHERGSTDFDAATGRITTGTLGTAKAAFAYDAVGRLITYDNTGQVEHYYYDGVRRVQTTVDRPAPQTPETRAEYIYGPDYVDEFVLQTYQATNPTTGQPDLFHAYYLQDANYNVMALLSAGGEPMEQYTWEPYGMVLTAETLPIPPPLAQQPKPPNRADHQGLFLYRFDLPTAPPIDPDPTALGLYYNRNRWYSPHLGRFTTTDPNASGQLLCSLQYGGSASQEGIAGYDAKDRYADGMNTLAYTRSNPVHATDPAGLAAHHLVPLYLGGASDGPGIELMDTQHRAFHDYLSDMGFPFGDGGRANWSRLDSTQRAFYIREAARTAGVEVDCQGFKRALVDAIAYAKQGEVKVASIRKAPKLYQVEMIDGSKYNQFLDDITPGGLGAAAKGMAVLNGVLMGVQMMDSLRFSNPHFRELLQATQRSQRTGQLSIMDEVTALDAMYNLTNDPFAGSYGWTAWRESLW